MSLCETFVVSFAASALANVIAVFLGIPAGLWLSRRTTRTADRKDDAKRGDDLHQSLSALEEAIAHNLRACQEVKKQIDAGAIILGFVINTSAWDITSVRISPLLRDVGLLVRLGYHFDELRVLERHLHRHAAYSIGVESAVGGAEKTQAELGRQLVPFEDRLLSDMDRLGKDIGRVKSEALRDIPLSR